MSILQPLHDIARDQRIELERTNKHISDVQKLLDDNPLQPCKWCNSAEHVKLCERLTPGETGQHLMCITCFNCKVQTVPQNCFITEPETFHSAAYDTIEAWNGQVK